MEDGGVHPATVQWNKTYLVVGAFLALLVVLGIYFAVGKPFGFVGKSYSQIYTLVDDKISQSAAVIVNLPKQVPVQGAEKLISFEPPFTGKFVAAADSATSVAFIPDKPLEIGKRYTVKLAVGEGAISKDFIIDEDPKVLEVFPKADSETDEHSAITIIFNRPMVPLTTLSELEQKNLAVTVTPSTQGKFKWISTRTLQFIPKDRLLYASHYSVKILQGFISTDGVPVPPAEYTFTTRPLRHEGSTSGTILYDQPIQIRFNEPVDLDRTTRALTLRNEKTGMSQPFIAEYGKSYEYDSAGKPKTVIVDRSVLSVYPKADGNGRSRIWDFDGAYALTLQSAYPLEGDINFSEPITTGVTITSAIKSFAPASERTALAPIDLFDPQGTVVTEFFEPVDLPRSDIAVKGLKSMAYAKMCKPTETLFNTRQPSDDTCEKVDDKTKIVMTFNAGSFTRGESFPVTFKKIVNGDGVTINSEPIAHALKVYPELKILSIEPDNGTTGASLTDLYICSNSPLLIKDKKDYKEAIQTTGYLVFNRWDGPYLRQQDMPGYPSGAPCRPGEYVNTLRYGLHPEKAYSIALVLEDVFGQKINRTAAFTTTKPAAFYSRFYNMQKLYNVTTPDRTKFSYAAENLESVNLYICKVAPATMLSYLNRRPEATAPDSTLDCIDGRRAVVDLPKVYWVNNYFQIDLKDYLNDPRGQYILSFSAPNYTGRDNGDGAAVPLYDRTFVSVTNLAVGEKKTQWTKYDTEPDYTTTAFKTSGSYANLYWVSNVNTLTPVVDARVRVYVQSGDYGGPITPSATGVTGADGVASIPLTKDIAGAVVTAGDDAAIISSWTDTLQWSSGAQSSKEIYMYTDRPIYRPGQDVFIKGLYRFQFDGRFDIFKNTTVAISVKNPKNEEVLAVTLPVSDFGTFVTHLKLPTDASLGTYNVSVDGLWQGSAYFEVAEYQGAAFEAKAASEKDEYIAGDTAEVSVSGTYYFGVPLAGGKLQYSWTAQDYYFDRYTDEYFNFGADWYSCASCGYGDSYIGSGQTTLDMTGKATVTENLDFKKLFKDDNATRSKIVVFHGTLQDLNGKSVSVQRSFIVHRGDFYLGVKADPSFAPTNSDIMIRAKTVDTQGKPLSESGIQLRASKVEWRSAKRQEVDGGFYSNYERVVTPVVTKNLNTGGNGDGSATLQFKEPGEYQIALVSSDRRANPITAETSVYVYGEGSASVQPQNNETLDVSAEKKDLAVGEQAKVIIKSPYTQAKALVTVERGRVFKYEIITIDRNFYEYTVPITEDYVPNVYVSVLLLSSHAEVKFGQVAFNVNTAHKALTVDVATDKASYLPGEKVTLTVRATDYQGAPQSAEVSISVADLSILALKGNPKKNPLVFFYAGLPLTVSTASNIKNILHEAEIPTGTKGGDGGNPADLARRKRGEFKDTAFWEGQVVTGADGYAKVSFVLPDNLTRWQIESVGITKDTKVGVNYKEFTAAKKVMAVPLAPRFVVPGDEFTIGANVFNQTDDTEPLSVTLDSPTLFIAGNAKQSVNLKPGQSTTLYFKVSAPQAVQTGTHSFTLSAKNGNFEDTVERTLPVKRNETYESVATAGSTKADKATEYVFIPDGVLLDRGGVTVRAQGSLAFFLKDAIAYMAQFPYGCSEQMASKLDMLAVLQRANTLKGIGNQFAIPSVEFNGASYSLADAVSTGLSRIYENQTIEGGFSYYQGLEPDLALSTHILGVLVDLKSAGFEVSEDALSRAAGYVGDTLLGKGSLYYSQNVYDTDRLIAAAYNLSRLPAPERSDGGQARVPNRPASYNQIISIIRAKVSAAYLGDRISSGALGQLALLITNEPALSSLETGVWRTLDNRIDIDSRGAYLKSNPSNIRWDYYETPEKNTALLVKAISVAGRDHTQTANMLRWLFASRDKAGAWGSTNTTLAVIDAVVTYLDWSKEGQSTFTLTVSQDGTPVGTHDFSGKSLFDTFEKFLPVSAFEPNKNHSLSLERTRSTGTSNFYYDIGLTYYLPVEKLPPRDEGVTVSRAYYALSDSKNEHSLSEAKVGDVLRGRIRLITPKSRSLFAVESFIPAGMELVDFNLATEDRSVIDSQIGTDKGVGYREDSNQGFLGGLLTVGSGMAATNAAYDTSLPQIFAEDLAKKEQVQTLYPDFKELHDDRLFLFNQNLSAGEYIYDFYARVTTAGTYRELPTVARELYFPEIFGRTEGSLFTIMQ